MMNPRSFGEDGSTETRETADREGTGFIHLATILLRRKGVVLSTALLVTALALVFSFVQEPLYEAQSEAYLSRQNFATDLTGAENPTSNVQADRIVQTEAELAGQPAVAVQTLAAVDVPGLTPVELRELTDIVIQDNADLLEFHVTHENPQIAIQLAAEYARQFKEYRRELLAAPLRRASDELSSQIDELRAKGGTDSKLLDVLLQKQQELSVQAALLTSNVFVVDTPERAEQVQPKPARNSLFGLLFGLLVGAGLAFLREGLDTRLRSSDTIGEILDAPLLARLPEPPRQLRRQGEIAMFRDPDGFAAEPFRMLRTNFEFANFERGAQVVMITSALESEGKSTTVANLAVSLARSGRRVALVDLDLRRPVIDRFFSIERSPGVTDVLLGRLPLKQALRQVPWAAPDTASASNGSSARPRYLQVLPAGSIPPNPGELMASRGIGELLTDLRAQADLVLVDTPPLLGLGDALAVSAHVDAIVTVTHFRRANRKLVHELSRVLDASPATLLGFALTGAEQEAHYAYQYGYGSTYGAPERVQVEIGSERPQ